MEISGNIVPMSPTTAHRPLQIPGQLIMAAGLHQFPLVKDKDPVAESAEGQLVRDVHHLLPLCNLLEPLIELVFRPRSPLLKATHSPAARR